MIPPIYSCINLPMYSCKTYCLLKKIKSLLLVQYKWNKIQWKKNILQFHPSFLLTYILRDRPFNLKGGGEGLWFFVSFRIFFPDNTRVRILLFLSHKAQIFFPEFNIRLYDKNSESDFFLSSTKIRIFFSATLGIRIFF